MKTFRSLALYLCLFFIQIQGSILAQSTNPYLVINEIGLSYDHSKNYIELLVIGDQNQPFQSINLEGWIIDNQNHLVLEDSTFLTLGSTFSNVLPGTLILIYDQNTIPAGVSSVNDGLPNSQGVYQLPINSTALNRCLKGGDYNCMEESSKNNWNDILSLKASGSALQLLDASGQLQYAVNWMGTQYHNEHHFHTLDLTPSGDDHLPEIPIEMGEWCDYYEVAYEHSPNGSPGVYNSIENGHFINDLASGSHRSPLDLHCFGGTPVTESDPLGSIDIGIEGGTAGYQIEWSGPVSGSQWVSGDTYTINDIPAGQYEIQVRDAQGCIKNCTFLRSVLRDGEICEGECTSIGEATDDCFKWEPTTGLQNPLSSETEACPEETTTYKLTLTDDDGNLLGEREYTVTVNEVEVGITPNPAMICDGESVDLDAGEGFVSYEWMDEMGNVIGNERILREVSVAGTYRVKVVDDKGCEGMAEVEVVDGDDPDSIKSYFEGEGFECIPISIIQLPGIVDKENPNRFVVDALIEIEGEEQNISELLNDLISRVTSSGYTAGGTISTNVDFCNGTFSQLLDAFNNSNMTYNVLIHIWENPDDAEDDCLFIKQKIRTPDNIPSEPINSGGYEGCNVGQNGSIYLDHKRALAMLDFAILALEAYNGSNPLCVHTELDNHFGGETSSDFAEFILANLKFLKFMSSLFADYKCEPNGTNFCGTSTFAYTIWCVPGFKISLCDPQYFDQSPVERSTTLIHEILHKYACNLDLGYYWNGNGIDYQQNSSSMQSLNADSYAQLVRFIYLNCQ